MKSLTTLRGMSRAAITELVEAAHGYARRVEEYRPGGSELEGRAVGLLFFEPSTRTRLSFELAARRLGADVLAFAPEGSSTEKGESLKDTATTIASIGADILVVRHPEPGIPDAVQDWTGAPVVNAGDGTHEHPTQALIDIVTLSRRFGRLDGLRMGIVGDILHSRVAGSLVHAMPALDVDLMLIGPEDFLPEDSGLGLEQSSDLDSRLSTLDVVYLLRVQTERGATVDSQYARRFGLDGARAARMKPDAVIMHPGPINRGVEISGEVADGPRSLILDQVGNGVATRMAVLAALQEGLR